MKKNFYFIKNPKWGLIALFMTICCLFDNTAFGQAVIPSSSTTNDILVWTGTVSSNWNDVDNWYVQSRATTGVAGISEYPGQDQTDDWAVIPSNGANPPIITTGQTFQVARVYVTNQFNAVGGTLTIDSGATLNVVNNGSITVTLNGGNIVNNGALNISSTGAGFTSFPVYGIQCGNPNILPSIPTEYGYSGTGTLSISLPSANFANSAAIAVTGNSSTTTTPTNNANVIYRMVLNNTTITYNQASAAAITAIRGGGGNNANKLIIAGTGVTIGTVGSPYIGSLISLGGGADVTVETGTTLTLNSISTNTNSAITGFSTNTFSTNVTNKGTINILGSSSRNGLGFSTGSTSIASVYNISNEGTLNVNLNCTRIGDSAYAVTNGGGGTANAGSVVNFNNASTGILTLKNTATAVGTGFPIFCATAGETARTIFNNNGIINLEGSTYNFGSKTTVNNNSIINTNNEFRSFAGINNNIGGAINFVKTADTLTTKQVNFNGVAITATASGGAVYTDGGGRQYTVVVQKFGTFGTSITTNTLASTDTSAISTTTGTLTLVSGTGTASIAFGPVAAAVGPPAVEAQASFSASSTKSALSTSTANSGTINTDTGSAYLNSLSGVSSTTGSSVIAPGGSAGKGIADFNKFAWVGLNGTAKIQVSGNTTAGVDYDQLNNSVDYGGLDLTYANLDVTGIYLPSGTLATPIDIMSTGSLAPLVGTFATVTGLLPGWSVQYTAPVGETIDPLTTLPYVPARRDGGKVQLAYVQTPYITQLSSNGTDTITQGCEGSTLVILGQKFTDATAVTINSVAVTGFTVVSDTRIDAVLPLGATTGVVAVSTAIATSNSSSNFTVVVNSDNTTAVTSFLTYTWPNNGQTYTESGIYTGTTTNCVTEKLDLTITTTQIPASFPSFCKGDTVATAKGDTGMVFYTAATGGTVLATTTALKNASTLWVSEIINSVETPTRLARVITVNNLPATPSALVSNPLDNSKLICKYIGTSTPVTFDATATGAVSYLWTAPGTAQVVSGGTTSSAGISFLNASTAAGAIGSVIVRSVDNVTGCISLPKTLALTTKLPTAPASLVMTSEDSTPNFDAKDPLTLITSTVGLNTLSKITKVGPYMGTNTVFTLTAPEAATAASYTWTLPSGVNQLSGGTSNVITVNFAGVTSGTSTLPIVVKSVGGCGESLARTLTLARALPSAPKALVLTSLNTTPRFSGIKDPLTGITPLVGLSTLTKITKVGPYQSTTIGFVLTATPFMVQGATATSYAWVLPAGVVCTSPNTATTVNVTVPPTEIGGTPTINVVNAIKTTTNTINILFNTTGIGNLDLLVFGVNGAGNSVARKLVVLRSLPTAPTKLVLTDDAISTTVAVAKVGAYVGKTTPLTLTGTPFTVQGAEGRTFFWTLPAGVNVTSGATLETDNGDTKTWKSSFTTTSSGMILSVNFAGVAPAISPSTTLSLPMSVNAVNLAGTSAATRTLTVTAAAPTAPAIVGSTGTTYSSCANTTYTATSFQGATYAWTIPAGAAIVGLDNTNVIVVDYSGVSVGIGASAAVTCIATNGVGSSPAKSLTVKRVAGTCRLSNSSASAFTAKAYPNPSSSEFTIETSRKGNTSVEVYDMQGRLIENRKANSNTVQVGSKLSAGAYNVIVKQDANVKTVRVIKK